MSARASDCVSSSSVARCNIGTSTFLCAGGPEASQQAADTCREGANCSRVGTVMRAGPRLMHLCEWHRLAYELHAHMKCSVLPPAVCEARPACQRHAACEPLNCCCIAHVYPCSTPCNVKRCTARTGEHSPTQCTSSYRARLCTSSVQAPFGHCQGPFSARCSSVCFEGFRDPVWYSCS